MVEMTVADSIGSLGVFILLVAFYLNARGYITNQSTFYLLLNIAGSLLACLASVMIAFYPFVVLEAIWCLVSISALVKGLKGAFLREVRSK